LKIKCKEKYEEKKFKKRVSSNQQFVGSAIVYAIV
jgi:hypothetical protein